MIAVFRTDVFDAWLEGLKDDRAKGRITMRLVRMETGALGDVKSVGEGVYEARIDYGPGYRLHFTQRGPVVILLLCGGDKTRQQRDITEAKRLAKEWKERAWD
ncbi:type II toxin-antitoxin system RelE/ParE family toxin [Rhizobium sp. G21]|uniref:type II toxin-antitoxin system RelE/ParE family toxin n=1 Tax=Rhizobium sp. G21 TaxID=2758439 RepID=UPI0016007B32|nr:type II toxin-antitoxin system RelE/ParE family toxin [Rhizobium sp. G21]MBB1247396.1 type II toxin-antitoxin system RelE/ParE family toxin [Rhizobium sp. G21]